MEQQKADIARIPGIQESTALRAGGLRVAASYAGDNSGNPASSLNLGFLIRKMGHGRGPSLQSRNGVLKATHVSISVFGGSGSSVHKSSRVRPDPPESWPDVDLLCRPLSHP